MSNACFQPDWFSKPGDTISVLMRRLDLSPDSLAQRLGRDISIIHGLLMGSVAVDDQIAAKLAETVGGTPGFWQRRQLAYDKALTNAARTVPRDAGAAWLRQLPVAEMVKKGWLEHNTRRIDRLRACLGYFDVSNPDEWARKYADFIDNVSFRTSPTFDSRLGALSAWLRQGEIKASFTQCAPWDRDRLRRLIPDLRKLTKIKAPKIFMPKLQEMCASAGVAVVYVRAPSGCRASGATRFLGPDRAMMILSFRYRTDDQFWFTFFHELGHLILHDEDATFVDGDETTTDKKEVEANAFSANILVPLERQEELMCLPARMRSIVRFAVSVDVSPGIIVGQLQKHGVLKPQQLNTLKRHYDWEELSRATSQPLK